MTHVLKISKRFFLDSMFHGKLFEIRIYDRPYKVGDFLILKEFDNGSFTGRFIYRQISYIHFGDGNFGLEKGFCVLGLIKP